MEGSKHPFFICIAPPDRGSCQSYLLFDVRECHYEVFENRLIESIRGTNLSILFFPAGGTNTRSAHCYVINKQKYLNGFSITFEQMKALYLLKKYQDIHISTKSNKLHVAAPADFGICSKFFDLSFFINLSVLLLQHIYFWFISFSYQICIFPFSFFSLFLHLYFFLSSTLSVFFFFLCFYLSFFSLLLFSPFSFFVSSYHFPLFSTFVAFQAIVVHTNLIPRKLLMKTPCCPVCQPNNKRIF